MDAARVRDRESGLLLEGAEHPDQVLLDPGPFAFHIRGVDQELAAASAEFLKRLRPDLKVRKFLPPVSDDIIPSVFSSSAAQVQYEPVPACGADHLLKRRLIELPVLKDIGSHNDMGRAGIEENAGCLRCDPASRLHSARKSRQRGKSLFKVLLVGILLLDGIKKNDVSSGQSHFPVDLRVIAGPEISREVLRGGAFLPVRPVMERAAHDLFDFAVMYIDTRSDPHEFSPNT